MDEPEYEVTLRFRTNDSNVPAQLIEAWLTDRKVLVGPWPLHWVRSVRPTYVKERRVEQ